MQSETTAPSLRMYYSIDDILAEAEEMSCSFRVHGQGIGYLDETNDMPDLEMGAKVDLPFWLAIPLSKRNIVAPSLPMYYRGRVMSDLKAHPHVVNVKAYCPHFFALGLKISKDLSLAPLALFLHDVFSARFQMILDMSQLFKTTSYEECYDKLAYAEKQVFDLKTRSSSRYEAWKREGTREIREADVIANFKRRRIT